ncbi:unnamed protein product [Sphagnum jensenii]|uniref:Uncharacterized protein n=1 Tax=Sphagnum jensenii TaxID=128206 RepID=A0ABP1AUE3_9BRYO
MEGGAVRIEQEDEEDQATRMENLALFEDMRYYYHQYGEEDSAAPPPPPHDLSTQLRDAALTGYRVSAHKGVGRDLLDSDSNKSDYDWLMTPPDTPLSSSSDQEAMVKAMQQQMIVRKVQPLISSIKSARKPGSGTERGETRMQRGNPSPQRASRSSTPTKKKQPLSPKPSTSPSRAAVGSSSQRPVTPTVRRSSTPTATLLSSTRGGAKMQSRNSSADVLPWNNSTSTTQRRSSTGSLFSSCTTSSRPFVSANPVPARTPSPTTITRQSFPDHTNNISRGSTPLRGGGRSQGSSPVRSSNNNNNFSRGRSPAKSHINRGNSLSSPRAILPVILDSFLSDTPVNLRTTDSRPSSQHAQLAAGYGHRGINQSSENLEKRTTKQSSIRRHSSSPTSKIQGSNSLLQSSRQHHWSGNSIDDNILVSSNSSIPSFYSTRPGIVNKKSHLDSRPVTPTSLSSSGCSGRSLVSATVEERISSEAHEQHELQNIVMPSSSQKRALSNGKHSDNNVMQNSFDLGGNKDGVLLASDKLKEEALIQEVEKGLKSQKQEQVMKKHIGYSSQSLNSLTRTRNPLKDIDRGGSEHMEDLNHDGCTCYDVEEMPQEIIILNERAADMRLGNIGGVGGSRDQVYKRDTDIFCEASQEDNIGSVPQITSERQEVNRRETSNLRKEEELLDGGCEDPSSLSSQGCKNGEVTADDNDLRFENSSDVIGDSHGGAAGESSGDIKGREQVMRDRTPPTMSELKGEMDNAGDLLNEKPYQVAEEDCTGEHGLRGHAGSDIRFIDIQEDACGGFWQYSDAKTSPQDNAVALTTKLASAAKSSQIFRGSYRGGECRKDDYLQGSLMRSSVSMSSTSATSIDLSRSSDTISSTPSSASLESTHNGLNSGFQDLKSRSEIAQVSNGNKVVDVCSVEAQDVDKEARSVVRGKVNIKITANLYSDAKLKKLAGYVRTVSLNARNQKGTQDDQNGAEEILSHDGCFDYFMDVLASQKSLDPEMREPHANSDVLASSHALETSKALVVSGTMTLAEATDKILFCSSIVHDLVYAAVALVGENDTENKNATLLIGSKPTSLDHDLLSDPTHSNHLQEPKFSSYNDLKNVGELLQPSTETEAMNLDNHKQRPVTEYSLDLLSKERKLTKDDELLLMISPPPDKLNNDDNNNSEMRDRHTSRSCACSIL